MYCCIMLSNFILLKRQFNQDQCLLLQSETHSTATFFFRLWNIKGLTHMNFQILFDFENDLNKGRGSITMTISASCDVTNGCFAERCVSADAF